MPPGASANSSSLESRGLVYLRMGQLDKAIADYDDALKRQPRAPGPMYGRGLAKVKQGKTAEGRADMQAAMALDPTLALRAQRYGLTALASDVVDEPNARTRFVLVGPPGPPPPRTGADRTSVVLRLDNVPGALVSAMTEFAIRDIDLTRIESRPTRRELGTYIFFLDCVGHIEDDVVAEALKALHDRCTDVRYLGSWPRDGNR